jgi:hypothetical protein
VPDNISVVWASLLEELLEVVCGRPRLALGAACDSRDAHDASPPPPYLATVTTIIVDRGCGLLKKLLAPFPAALLVILDGDSRRCLLAVAWGQAKLSNLVAGGVLGGDVVQLLGGVLEDID